MNIFERTGRAAARTAEATAAGAGAVGGAAMGGVVGGLQGVATGVRGGLSDGSRSTPAAALTFAALGATGLVEWPLLLAVGATALVVRQVRQRPPATSSPALAVVPGSDEPVSTAAPRKRPAKSASKTAPRKTASRTRRAPSKR